MASIGKKLWEFLWWLCQGTVALLLSAFQIKLPDEKWNVLEQFFKFACVGCINSLILLFVYYVVVFVLGKDLYLLGQTLGYIAGIINSYILNQKFVFSDAEIWTGQHKVFLRMCMCYGISYFIQMGILYIGVEILKVGELVVPIIAILITTPANFLMNKWFAFQDVD